MISFLVSAPQECRFFCRVSLMSFHKLKELCQSFMTAIAVYKSRMWYRACLIINSVLVPAVNVCVCVPLPRGIKSNDAATGEPDLMASHGKKPLSTLWGFYALLLGARIQVSGGKKVSWLRYTTCLTTRPDNGVFPWNRNYKKSYFFLSGLKARTVPFYMYMWQIRIFLTWLVVKASNRSSSGRWVGE